MLAQHFLSNVKTRITHGIIFEEDYNSVIIFEITLAQNFLSNVREIYSCRKIRFWNWLRIVELRPQLSILLSISPRSFFILFHGIIYLPRSEFFKQFRSLLSSLIIVSNNP